MVDKGKGVEITSPAVNQSEKQSTFTQQTYGSPSTSKGNLVKPSSIPKTNVDDKPPQVPQKRKKCQPNRPNKNVTSQIWQHFTIIEGSDPPRASCNYCKKDYAADSHNNGTTSLWRHLENKCIKYPYRKDKSQKPITDFAKGEIENTLGKLKKLDIKGIRKSLAKMVIIDEWPFRIVEGEGFKGYSQALETRFIVPGRITVARDCMKLYEDEKKALKKCLKSQRVCLTTDTWTSVQNLNYMCLTAHWIDDDWKLQKRILNFLVVENHKGNTIGKVIEECLMEWDIEKVLTLTVDNASSNDLTVDYLKRNTKWKETILENKFLHVRCCAHIVNMIVKDGLNEQSKSIVRIRNAIKYVRSSPSRSQAFKKCVEMEKIESKHLVCLDIDTRWNSTYLMLEHAQKFEWAFKRLEREDNAYVFYFDNYDDVEGCVDIEKWRGKGKKIIGPPSFQDWIDARHFVKFLKLFYLVTLKISGSSFVTSNLFFHEMVSIYANIDSLGKSNDVFLKRMATKMREKFDKYWSNVKNMNELLFIDVVLDPRYKMKYVTYCLNLMHGSGSLKGIEFVRNVENALDDLYYHYMGICESHGSEVRSDTPSSTTNNMEVDEVGDVMKFIESGFDKHLEQVDDNRNVSELSQYFGEPHEKREEAFDILNWWKCNSSRYPILSRIARDVLAIPVSTVSSEQEFSTSGRILDPFRSSLDPKTVQALICAQSWLRSKPIDLVDAMEEIEKYEEMQEELSASSTCTIHNVED